MVLPSSRRLAESADSDAWIAYAMSTTHDMFWLSLEADKAVDIGSQQLPILPIALKALSPKGHYSLLTIFHVGEHTSDIKSGVGLSTLQIKGVRKIGKVGLNFSSRQNYSKQASDDLKS